MDSDDVVCPGDDALEQRGGDAGREAVPRPVSALIPAQPQPSLHNIIYTRSGHTWEHFHSEEENCAVMCSFVSVQNTFWEYVH